MQVSTRLENRPATDIVWCGPDEKLGNAVRMLAQRRIGAMPVMEGERVIGIISERDVMYCLAADGAAALEKPVSGAMTAPAVTVECSASCDDTLALMTERRFRHVPVVENGAMRGFLSIGDLVKSRIDEISHEARAMRDYISMA